MIKLLEICFSESDKRGLQTINKYKAAKQTKIPKKLIQPVNNPTLLSDRELDRALRHYTGHERYIDLITYLGETKTIGLLLKLVLLCSKVKPYLEQRFSILFSHYESVAENEAPWLIKSLENLQVAFSVYFGQADFSLIQII